MTPKKVLILNHTHWDREWYETFDQFRLKLFIGIQHIVKELQSGTLDCFYLDGQTVVIEDYCQIATPEDQAIFKLLIEQGKIEVGPWFLLPDEFLVSGEALIKNLQYGCEMAKEHGSFHHIAYLPDTFGHISQIPQLFTLHEIDCGLIWRGATTHSSEVIWRGADGSELKTLVLPLFEGYYQTYLMEVDYIDKVGKYIEQNSSSLVSEHLLLMNGADHTINIVELQDKMEKLHTKYPDITFEQTTMQSYVQTLRNNPNITEIMEGERRDNDKIFLLPGVLSTRSYLKVQNQRSEDMAIHQLGTLGLLLDDYQTTHRMRAYIWKMLLKNHPHDSICGTSIDEVHNEMEIRSQKLQDAITQYVHNGFEEQYPFVYNGNTLVKTYLYVTNLVPFAKQKLVKGKILIKKEHDLGSIAIFTEAQTMVDMVLCSRVEKEVFFRQVFQSPQYIEAVEYEFTFLAPFWGIELQRYEVISVEKEPLVMEKRAAVQQHIENQYYQIEVADDSITIIDKLQRKTYSGQHHIVSTLDAGDSYNYSPPTHDEISRARIISVSVEQGGDCIQKMHLMYNLTTPSGLCENRTAGTQDYVSSSYETTMTLYQSDPVIYFSTTVDNKARDHKSCVTFAIGDHQTSCADTAFDVVQRRELEHILFDADDNKESKMNQAPTQSFVSVGQHYFMHRGLQEYEVQAGVLKVTLLRCIGHLSRRDLRTRKNGAGPSLPLEGAQCLRKQTFEYALKLCSEQDQSPVEALNYRVGTLTWQSTSKQPSKQILRQHDINVTYSSAEPIGPNTWQIRLFNHTEVEQNDMLEVMLPVDQIREVNLLGRTLTTHCAAQVIELSFRPKEIKTIEITLKRI